MNGSINLRKNRIGRMACETNNGNLGERSPLFGEDQRNERGRGVLLDQDPISSPSLRWIASIYHSMSDLLFEEINLMGSKPE